MERRYAVNAMASRTLRAIACIALAAGTALAGNGKLTGKVTDKATGEPLPGVNVLITHVIGADGVQVPMTRALGGATNAEGYFFILDVPPGVYAVKASAVGRTPITQTMVRVDLDRTVNLDFQLSSTEIPLDQIVVTAKRDVIKPDVSGTQEVITTTRIEQMPILRIDEFVGRLKGIQLVSTSEGNGLSVRGGSIRETDVRLDGISLQDPRSEESYLALNSTAIEEIQVLSGGFEAKYGGIRSGLLNVVTKEGQRDRYKLSLKIDGAPAYQKKYFGTDPWSQNSWIYRVYADTNFKWAMNGIKDHQDSITVPSDFWQFIGWKANGGQTSQEKLIENRLTPQQKLDLWKLQHPGYANGEKPDYYVEGTLTGPFPGSFIPFLGDYAERTTFLLGFKYENSQLAFPIGPRDNYLDWNFQSKLTTQISNTMQLSVNGMYAKVATDGGGARTSYGGALGDQASSFGFLNSTDASVNRQAALIGGGSWDQIYNKSRLQYYDQRYFVGGARFTHTVSENAFYTVDFQVGYTDQRLSPFAMDTSVASQYASFFIPRSRETLRFFVPTYGSPNASTNYGFDLRGDYTMFGGPQRVDSSYSWVYQLKGDFTAQLGRHHQVEAGVSARLENLFVYSGTWFQSQLSYTPDTWQYYWATPLTVGAYVQDKLEFQGMILNGGVRLDYLNPMKDGFQVGFPESDAYQALYNNVYSSLPGGDTYERWFAFRALLDNPPGWPRTENRVQAYLSPRVGVSFPVTENSKLYFNYGHFYQRPPISFMYDLLVVNGGVGVPTPGLSMARTVSYEFGYEQSLWAQLLLNVTAYYKDVRNEPLNRTFVNFYGDNIVSMYVPDAYRDIRGLELRCELPAGKFVSFNALYNYMIQSSGQTGLDQVFEDRLKAINNELRSPNLYTPYPLPQASLNLNLHTPENFGPETFGMNLLGGMYANLFFDWQSGGSFLLNPEADPENWIYIDRVSPWSIDFRGSKKFATSYGSIEFVVTITNLTNNKWLIPENMTQKQYTEYKNSLKTPDKGGNDKWGQYESSDNHIKVGWYDAPIFLNPRRLILGARLNL